jgi:ankyrin repeat protein
VLDDAGVDDGGFIGARRRWMPLHTRGAARPASPTAGDGRGDGHDYAASPSSAGGSSDGCAGGDESPLARKRSRQWDGGKQGARHGRAPHVPPPPPPAPPQLLVSVLYCPAADTLGSLDAAPSWTLLHRAAADGNVPLLKACVEKLGREWLLRRTCDDSQMTALDVALLRKHVKAVEALLQYPVTRTTSPLTGRSCLHHAALSGDANVMRRLVQAVLTSSRNWLKLMRAQALMDGDVAFAVDPDADADGDVDLDAGRCPEPGYLFDFGRSTFRAPPPAPTAAVGGGGAGGGAGAGLTGGLSAGIMSQLRLAAMDADVIAELEGIMDAHEALAGAAFSFRSPAPALRGPDARAGSLLVVPGSHAAAGAGTASGTGVGGGAATATTATTAATTATAAGGSPSAWMARTMQWLGRPGAKPRGSESTTPPADALKPVMMPILRPLDVRDRFGFTPLATAAACGFSDVVDVLLASGAAPGVSTHSGDTPLMLAARHGHAAVALRLLRLTDGRAGAAWLRSDRGNVSPRPHARNAQGECALLLAARAGLVDVVSRLVHVGCRRGVGDLRGDTPLHAAVAASHADIVRVLLLREASHDSDGAGPRVDSDGEEDSVTVNLGPGLRRGIGIDGRGVYTDSDGSCVLLRAATATCSHCARALTRRRHGRQVVRGGGRAHAGRVGPQSVDHGARGAAVRGRRGVAGHQGHPRAAAGRRHRRRPQLAAHGPRHRGRGGGPGLRVSIRQRQRP